MPKQHLLLTGIPGTGKTTTGEYLATHHGFTHIDREEFDQWPKYYQIVWRRSIRMFVRIITLRYDKLVVSWGFNPKNDLAEVHLMVNNGFAMIWFDGDREVAKKMFVQRGGSAAEVEVFEEQLTAIDQLDLSQFPHLRLNPFSDKGSFKAQEEIVGELFTNVSA
jgi:hypothetical protein